MAWDPARLFPAFKRAGMLEVCRYQPQFGVRREVDVSFVQPDVGAADGLVRAPETVIEYQTADAPDLAAGVEVELCGIRYTVLGTPQRQADGFYSRAVLSLYSRGTQA
jgi:hypothetical protein